jgi:hypothetical protein
MTLSCQTKWNSEVDAIWWLLWKREYNDEWPHGLLQNLTRRAFAEQVVLPRQTGPDGGQLFRALCR